MKNQPAVASRLQIEFFKKSCRPESEKSQLGKNDRGKFVLSLIVPGYHFVTISKFFVGQKVVFFGFRLLVHPTAPACSQNLGLKISPIESP